MERAMGRPQIGLQTPVSWSFNYDVHEGRWTWRQLSIDGSIAHISSAFSDYGAAVVDAIKHGFRPREHHWVVMNRTGITHFHPGNAPVSIAPDGLVVQRPTGDQRVPIRTKRQKQREFNGTS